MTDPTDSFGLTLPDMHVLQVVGKWLRAALASEGVLAIGTLTVILALNAPFFQLPYYWDSLWIIAGAEGILENDFKPLLPAAWDMIAHPVLLHEILALTWLVLGQALWVSHLVMVGFAFLTVYFTYCVGRQIYDRRTGVVAASLLLFYPLFRTQSTVVLLDLPTAAFAIMAVYFLLRRRTLLYLIFASAMVLTKATGVLLIPAVLLYLFIGNRQEKPRQDGLADLAVHSIPVLVLVGWFWYHTQETGWWTVPWATGPSKLLSAYLPPLVFSQEGTPYRFVQLSARYFGKVFLTGVLALFIAAYSFSIRPFLPLVRSQLSWQAILGALKEQPVWRVWGPKEQIILLGLPITTYLAFMSSSLAMHRYLLPVYTFFFILAGRAIVGLLKDERRIAGVTIAALLVFTMGWTRPWFGFSLASPSTLMYVDFVRNHEKAASLIESTYPDRIVLAGWPQYIELSMPTLGYVDRPIGVMAYADPEKFFFTLRMDALGARFFSESETVSIEDFDLVYYSDHTYRPDAKMILDIVERYQLPLIAEFEQNDEYVAIYANPRSIDLSAGKQE